jgi:hypothetical protein
VLLVILKNKLQKNVKVLFSVTRFGVLRRQTAETCNTGGVFQDPFVLQSLDSPQVRFGGHFEAQHRQGIASTGSHKGDRVWMITDVALLPTSQSFMYSIPTY